MARSFYAPSPANMPETRFYHQASDTWYAMERKEGKYIQRRWRIVRGKPANVEESEVAYIMGSGNHVRTYLRSNGNGGLTELPLAWYAEKGGYWAMNPGYDLDRSVAPRRIDDACMFCHNGYPKGSESVYREPLPQGIDCQRCHGPGSLHVQAAQSKTARPEDVRAAIVNPARLKGDRQMEVCMQCHLQATAYRLPASIRRLNRGPFSYRAGEPLRDFELFFDRAPEHRSEAKFEIVSSAYRLRQSACFLKSAGVMTCLTCHDPHNIPRGEAATAHYNGVCRTCHATVAAAKHTRDGDCTGCHMPKRRTYDVVHAVMTDHLIQKNKPPGDLLADMREIQETDGNAYQGEVVPYYPQKSEPLYTDLAQVRHRSNLAAGIGRLANSEAYIDLGDAYRNAGNVNQAISSYQRAGSSPAALLKLGETWKGTGQLTQAADVLNKAVQAEPASAQAWYLLGSVYAGLHRMPEAADALRKAVALDRDFAGAYNSLGAVLAEGGDAESAREAFETALRIDPASSEAEFNLGLLMGSRDKLSEAIEHLTNGLRLKPANAAARLNLGVALAKSGDLRAARQELTRATASSDPEVQRQARDILAQIGGAR